MAKDLTLNNLEQKIFNYYSFDLEFQKYKVEKVMHKSESHYKYALIMARSNKKSYEAFLPVIFRWLDEAYMHYGRSIAQEIIDFEAISKDCFEAPINSWRRKNLTYLGNFSFQKSGFKEGYYRIFHYYLKFEKDGVYYKYYHPAMPPSLNYLVQHYLSHHYQGQFNYKEVNYP
ncbi:MAG: hypothetical protein COB02_06155 [Candidatus Cloacimonadota bacterium]|nr:MAG: hypothetical protein COB02_06155 [Candidatus Cloacimonadota bacterium]